ncbi:MAG: hypothetical protein CMM93_06725 [Rickettsiales bacterium]|nr:hypothetical protein [Rickettsiales bacterium]|tara:strand:+ start:591 stop:1322 length:732 start_codon:yes stop_codon:yes gene_type:complete
MTSYNISQTGEILYPLTDSDGPYTSKIYNYSPDSVDVWWYTRDEYNKVKLVGQFSIPEFSYYTLKNYTRRDFLTNANKNYAADEVVANPPMGGLYFAPGCYNGLYLVQPTASNTNFYPLFGVAYAFLFDLDGTRYRAELTEDKMDTSYKILNDNSRGYCGFIPNSTLADQKDTVPLIQDDIYVMLDDDAPDTGSLLPDTVVDTVVAAASDPYNWLIIAIIIILTIVIAVAAVFGVRQYKKSKA